MVNASEDASEIGKFVDTSKVTDGLSLRVGLADWNSALFQKASEAIKTISVKYSVFTVEILNCSTCGG